MRFGIFDHMDATGAPLGEQYENRLQLIEACDRSGFYAYHLAEHHWGWRRRRVFSWRRSLSAPGNFASGLLSICSRFIIRCD